MGIQEVLMSTQPGYAGARLAGPAAHEEQSPQCDIICQRVRLGYYAKPEILEQVLDALVEDVRAGIPAQPPGH